MPPADKDARLSLRLSGDLKRMIEDAAAEVGQTINEFANVSLAEAARKILQDRQVTRLSDRDRRRFVSALDDKSNKPNEALVKAAKRYRKQVG
jgi:uncharacterized protein (DUF1778 family)